MLVLHTLALPATSSSVKRRFSLKRSAPGSVHYLRGSTFLVVSPFGSKRGDFLAHRRQHLRGEWASTKMVDEPLLFYGMGHGCLRVTTANISHGGGGKNIMLLNLTRCSGPIVRPKSAKPSAASHRFLCLRESDCELD